MQNLSYENKFDFHLNGLVGKIDFHMKGFALGLILKLGRVTQILQLGCFRMPVQDPVGYY